MASEPEGSDAKAKAKSRWAKLKTTILTQDVLTKASVFMIDAALHRTNKYLRVDSDPNALWWYGIYNSRPVTLLLLLVVFVDLIMAYWERPATHAMPIEASNGIELFCMGIFIFELFMRYKCLGGRYLHSGWMWAKAIAILIILIDIVIDFCLEDYIVRYSRVLRFIFVADFSDRTRHLSKQLLRTYRRMLPIIGIILLFVSSCAVFGYILFVEEDDIYFRNYFEAFLNMFTAMTTTNFPDVMIPAYRLSNWYLIYFVPYMVLALFYGYNMTLAFSYSAFKDVLVREAYKLYKVRRKALRAAFHCLDPQGSGSIPIAAWRSLYQYLLPSQPEGAAEAALAVLGPVPPTQLRPKDFYLLCTKHLMDPLAAYHKETVSSLTGTQRIANAITAVLEKVKTDYPAMKWMCGIVNLRWSWMVVVGLLVLNVAAIVVCVANGRSILEPQWTFAIDTAITGIFLVEVVIRSLGEGLVHRWWNCLDLLVMSVVVMSKVFGETIAYQDSFEYLRAISFLRALKLVRLCTIKLARGFVKTTVVLLAALMYMVAGLLILYYLFALIGIFCFSGKLSVANADILDKIDYGALNYYYLANFNTFADAMMCLFHLMVVNNFWVTMRGAMAVTSNWACIYFLAFYFFAVVIALNLCIAFLIEAVRYLLDNAGLDDEDARSEELIQRMYREDLENLAMQMEEPETEHQRGSMLDMIKLVKAARWRNELSQLTGRKSLRLSATIAPESSSDIQLSDFTESTTPTTADATPPPVGTKGHHPLLQALARAKMNTTPSESPLLPQANSSTALLESPTMTEGDP